MGYVTQCLCTHKDKCQVEDSFDSSCSIVIINTSLNNSCYSVEISLAYVRLYVLRRIGVHRL